MNEISKQVIGGVTTALILSLLGYVFVVKDNQNKIGELERLLKEQATTTSKEIAELNIKLDNAQNLTASHFEKNQSTIDALKLFVVAAHPTKSHVTLASYSKLQSLQPSEFGILTLGLSELKGIPTANWKDIEFEPDFKQLVSEYKLDQKDFKEFIKDLESAAPNL